LAAYNKFNNFVDYLVGNVSGQSIKIADTWKVLLTNTAPVATNTKYSDISAGEVANGNGYVTGGAASTVTAANSSGTETVTAADVTFTASGGSIGPFRYAVFYDTTPTDKPLACWFDYGSSITLNSGESFTVQPNSSSPTGTLFTLV